MDKVKEVSVEYGSYLFKLERLLADKNISINRLLRETNTDFKVIKRIMTGDLVRIDILVLARICNFLECDISDILEYVKKPN